MFNIRSHVKSLRFTFLSILNTTYGLVFSVLLVFFCAFSSLHFISSAFSTPPTTFTPLSPFSHPVDVVYTWVNGSDPSLASSLSSFYTSLNKTVPANRYRHFDELKYSLRSLEMFAPWVRRVFIITDNQIPVWIRRKHPRLTFIDHRDLFDPSVHSSLPVFSSPAIESQFHRLDQFGVSEHFIYFNDDFFFGAPVDPTDFFSPSRGQSLFFTWPVPECSPGCSSSWIGDGTCDSPCNNEDCGFDGGDCEGTTSRETPSSSTTNPWSWDFTTPSTTSSASFTTSRYCSSGCFISWVGDGYCDALCNNKACAFDGGECSDSDSSVVDLVLIKDTETAFASDISEQSVVFDLSELFSEISVDDCSASHIPVEFGLVDSQSFAIDCLWTVIFNKINQRLYIVFRRPEQLKENFAELTSLEADIPTSFEHVITITDSKDTVASIRLKVGVTSTEPLPTTESERMPTLISMPEPLPSADTSQSAGDVPMVETEVDHYSKSLVYVDKLLTSKFKAFARRVPAHMPYYIQLPVLKDIYHNFKTEIDNTATHRLRASTDVQFSLMYFSYINEAKKSVKSGDEWFKFYDVNGDSLLCRGEVNTLLADLFDPVTKVATDWLSKVTAGTTELCPAQYLRAVNNGTNSLFDLAGTQMAAISRYGLSGSVITHHDENYEPVSFDFCLSREEFLKEPIIATLNSLETTRPRYKTFQENLDHVAFHPVTDNPGEMSRVFNGIRRRRPKFLCLNDDLHSNNPNTESIRLFQDFLEDYFHVPSSFEALEFEPAHKKIFLYLFSVLLTVFVVFAVLVSKNSTCNKHAV
ncbi:hypothetical protein RCL1_003342 [Eukaryota sp. TZLM3-RCL]